MIHHIEYVLFLEIKRFSIGGLLQSFSKSVPPQGFYTFLLKIIKHASKFKKDLVATPSRSQKSKFLFTGFANDDFFIYL